tara:strand:- start:642 stop:818 length:177 start_codon:yes stop_codon:yes gene_type:complete
MTNATDALFSITASGSVGTSLALDVDELSHPTNKTKQEKMIAMIFIALDMITKILEKD